MPAPLQYRFRWPAALAAVLALGACAANGPNQQQGKDPIGDWLAHPGAVEPASAGRPSMQPAPPPGTSPPSGLVVAAMSLLDVRYRRGGDSAEQGFDCSGFTRHVFETAAGVLLPRRSRDQARASGLRPITRDELQPGDLVFFNTLRAAFSHVGIYVGEGRFIHAPRSGAAVRIENMSVSYWRKRYDGARRAPSPAEAPAVSARIGAAPAAPALQSAAP